MVCNLQICGPYMCSFLCYSADKGKKWRVNQVKSKPRTLGRKNALVSTVKSVLSNRYNMKNLSTLYSYMADHTQAYIPASLARRHADRHTLQPFPEKNAHTYNMLSSHVGFFCVFIFWYRIKKCSYVTVSVMHTWGPNSYIIYKEKTQTKQTTTFTLISQLQTKTTWTSYKPLW